MASKRRKKVLTHEIRFRGGPLDCKRLKALAHKWELTESAVLRRLLAEATKVGV